MHTVSVEKACGCFKRSSFENNIQMDNKDDAMMYSLDMLNQMNSKHQFILREVGENFVIAMNETAAHGCCVGGCH